jgi:hypothetical protein
MRHIDELERGTCLSTAGSRAGGTTSAGFNAGSTTYLRQPLPVLVVPRSTSDPPGSTDQVPQPTGLYESTFIDLRSTSKELSSIYICSIYYGSDNFSIFSNVSFRT